MIRLSRPRRMWRQHLIYSHRLSPCPHTGRFAAEINLIQMDHQLIQLTRPTPAPPSSSANDARLGMCSSLYLAVYRGHVEEVMALLLQRRVGSAAGIQHGQCNIYEVSAETNTILHVAAEQGHDKLIRELYLRFRDKSLLSSRNSALDTPLHCAARAGRGKAVSLLVQLAQDCGDSILGCKNEAGDTSLHLAARRGHGEAVEALVSAAPDLACELNGAGMSPLYLAVMSGSVPAVSAITTRCRDASSVGPSSQNALHAAVFQSSEMVDLLLQWKPSLAGKVDCNGSSPLHFASSDGDRSIVSAILCRAAPSTVYMKDKDGLSALHVAALMGHDRVVKKLIKACPDAVELRDNHGGTFLHAAAKEKRCSVVSLAIKNPMLGGLLNAQDREGNTPLHLAVVAGVSRVAEALVRKGKVRADVMNNDGHTPLDLAAKSTSFFTMISLVLTLVAFGAQSRPQRQDLLKQWSGRDIAQWIETTSDSLAVVAVLIATVAFSAAFNVPGGYGGDGKVVLQNNIVFECFLFLDTVAMVTSVVAVILLVYGKASRSAGSWKSFVAALHFMWVSLICMILAFYAALSAVASTKAVNPFAFVAIYVCISWLSSWITRWIAPAASWRTIWRFVWRGRFKGRQHAIRRRIRRQYPFPGASMYTLLLFTVEISLLSRLEHENIVQYFGTDKEGGKLYIFLELVTQGSLAALYQKNRLQDSHVSAYTR